jgi:RNA polymerase sigma-70 factor (ECF subfamily)
MFQRRPRLRQFRTRPEFDQDDDELATRASVGDQAAFAELVRRHEGLLRSVGWSITGSTADAEDIAQEAFVRAWRGVRSYRSGGSFKAWVVKMAMNLAIDEMRRRTRQRRFILLVRRELPDPEIEALRSLEEESLRKALARLPRRDAQVLVLRYFADLSHGEIAELLGSSDVAVRIRVCRALKRMRALL